MNKQSWKVAAMALKKSMNLSYSLRAAAIEEEKG